jgi:hypothetical protein
MISEPGNWLMFADLTLVVHAVFVLFIVGGQIAIVAGWGLGWLWTRHLVFRLLHLIAIGFVMFEVWFGAACPLTVVENLLRTQAGAAAYDESFIGHWLAHLIFYTAPEWVFTFFYTVFAAVVVVTWLVYPPRRKT